MDTIRMNLRISTFLKIILISFVTNSAFGQSASIIPIPISVEFKKGVFRLSKSTIIAGCSDSELCSYLQSQIKAITSIELNTKNERQSNDKSTIVLTRTKEYNAESESYKLTISENQIEISASSGKGLFYGIQSLIQLIPVKKYPKIEIPCQAIIDSPRFGWRGMLLDVSRHFFAKEDVKKFIDLLALHKMNVFHWHLTDDHGWRIEIKKYPKLTSVGAWREDRRGEIWNIDDEQRIPYPEGKPYYGGYYTQDDIREIVRYAAERHVQIIPEIEMPGHSRAALVAYPEFSCFGRETKVPSGGYVGDNWDFSDPYCAGNDQTFIFLQDILDEVMRLFPSQFIHIGGDECSKRIWKTCAKCQQRIKDEHLKDEFELQSYFIKRIEKYINSKGKRMIGWQEILEGGMNPSAVIQPWRGEDALKIAIEAAENGHQLIMSPSSHLYFNSPWENSKNEQGLSLEKTYSYEPIDAGLYKKYCSSVIGVEGCMWSELTPDFKAVEYQTMPRIAALSEIGWSTKENRNLENFKTRLNKQSQLYKRLCINYYVPAPNIEEAKIVFTDHEKVSLGNNVNSNTIRYTTNGHEPTIKSKKCSKPFSIKNSTTFKVAAFDAWGQKSETKKVVFEKQTYRKPESVSNLSKGLMYQLYEGKIRSADEIEQALLLQKGIIDSITVVDRHGIENGGMILTGYIQIPTKGIYTFHLASDDGSKLYIGDYCVVDNNGYTAAKNRNGDWLYKSGKIALESGMHPITIRYFDWSGGENINLQFECMDIVKQNISKEVLFH